MVFICILDFEATCWEENGYHEIIEFPSVMLKWEPDQITRVGEIQNYVKPKIKPIISEFCTALTGITQDQIDEKGIELEQALRLHTEWMESFGVNDNITIVTCGIWDLDNMLPNDLKIINLNPPAVYKRYVNIKNLFNIITSQKAKGMSGMLQFLNLELEGRHHSGIDDSRNIGNIFCKLVTMGLTKDMFVKYIQTVDYNQKWESIRDKKTRKKLEKQLEKKEKKENKATRMQQQKIKHKQI
jgi:inhibitor of KinA sporulation pathway (predicted exonuclease)